MRKKNRTKKNLGSKSCQTTELTLPLLQESIPLEKSYHQYHHQLKKDKRKKKSKRKIDRHERSLSPLDNSQLREDIGASSPAEKNHSGCIPAVPSKCFCLISDDFIQYAHPVVNIYFIGKLGQEQLAAATLVMVWFHLVDVIITGFINGNGGYISRYSLIHIFALTLAMSAFLGDCGHLMSLIRIDLALVDEAELFAKWLIPGVLPHYLFKFVIKNFQMNSSMFFPGISIGMIAIILNASFNRILVLDAGWGVTGSAVATSLTRIAEFLFLILYMSVKKTFPKNDNIESSIHALDTLMVMLTQIVESWNVAVLTLVFACQWDIEALAANGIILIISFFLSIVPTVIGVTSSVQVGQHVKDCNVPFARKSFCVSFFISLIGTGIAAAILVFYRGTLANLFTDNEEVAYIVSESIPIMSFSMLSMNAFIDSMFRGQGLYRISILLNIFFLWIVSIPAVMQLVDMMSLDVKGLWWGLSIGKYGSSLIGICILTICSDTERDSVPANICIDKEMELRENLSEDDCEEHINNECHASLLDLSDIKEQTQNENNVSLLLSLREKMKRIESENGLNTDITESEGHQTIEFGELTNAVSECIIAEVNQYGELNLASSPNQSSLLKQSIPDVNQDLLNRLQSPYNDNVDGGGNDNDVDLLCFDWPKAILKYSSLNESGNDEVEQKQYEWLKNEVPTTNHLPIKLIAAQLQFNGPSLTTLVLDGRKEISHDEWNDVFQSLLSNHNLEQLSVDDCDLTDKDLVPLLQALSVNKTVRIINLSHNLEVDDDTGKALIELLEADKTTLEEISINGTRISSRTEKRLGKLLQKRRRAEFTEKSQTSLSDMHYQTDSPTDSSANRSSFLSQWLSHDHKHQKIKDKRDISESKVNDDYALEQQEKPVVSKRRHSFKLSLPKRRFSNSATNSSEEVRLPGEVSPCRRNEELSAQFHPFQDKNGSVCNPKNTIENIEEENESSRVSKRRLSLKLPLPRHKSRSSYALSAPSSVSRRSLKTIEGVRTYDKTAKLLSPTDIHLEENNSAFKVVSSAESKNAGQLEQPQVPTRWHSFSLPIVEDAPSEVSA